MDSHGGDVEFSPLAVVAGDQEVEVAGRRRRVEHTEPLPYGPGPRALVAVVERAQVEERLALISDHEGADAGAREEVDLELGDEVDNGVGRGEADRGDRPLGRRAATRQAPLVYGPRLGLAPERRAEVHERRPEPRDVAAEPGEDLRSLEHGEAADDGRRCRDGGDDLARDLLAPELVRAREPEDLGPRVRGGGDPGDVTRGDVVLVEDLRRDSACVEIKYSTRIQCARNRTVRTSLFEFQRLVGTSQTSG
mmetsp:Transcript_31364/g.101888  ORF Transcript_31364/g.101888 Transcript_31364/m.101888 type:complete len:251 (-) Transcript_31364:8-760(-)